MSEIKNCGNCKKQFEITQNDIEFYDKISPVFLGKKYEIPKPSFCPECRKQRRLARRNERKFYHRKSDLSGKNIISLYSLEKTKYTVYNYDERRSDKRDPINYGKVRTPKETLFQQFQQLYKNVPRIALSSHVTNTNSLYTNYIVQSKNCYMCFGGAYNENVYHGATTIRCVDCVDVYLSFDCTNCYSIFWCDHCTNVFYSDYNYYCNDSYFLENCEGCNFCFACIGLKNQSYNVFNKKVTKEKFKLIIEKFQSKDTFLLKQIDQFLTSQPHKPLNILQSENILGNNIINSKNSSYCFNINDAEDMKFCDTVMFDVGDNYDCNQLGINGKLIYESITGSMNLYKILFCTVIRDNCENLLYCSDISDCTNCFACIGLRHKKYCILNTQYTKEEYEILVPKIIEKMRVDGEWGEFFPISMSPFAYNETVAHEEYPMLENEAFKKGYSRKNKDKKNSTIEIHIPLSIHSYMNQDNKKKLLNSVIKCNISGNLFKIIPQELEFYIKNKLKIPTQHPNQRYLDRMVKSNSRQLRNRKCCKCEKKIITRYSPNRAEVVYCEDCYNNYIYGNNEIGH